MSYPKCRTLTVYKGRTLKCDPNYNVILINKNSLVVHTEDFLKDNINWFETTKKF